MALRSRSAVILCLLTGAALGASWPSAAAPYRPPSDGQVLVELPDGPADPAQRALRRWRQQLGAEPRNAALAQQVAAVHLRRLAAEGDPRDAGLAQAALAPWWNEPSPPVELRVQRAVLRQFGHDFDGARADLLAVTESHPDHAQAWSWLAAIAMVQARWADARVACGRLPDSVSPLMSTACDAAVDAATGQARRAAARIEAALAAEADADPALRLWAMTRLAEAYERLGETRPAEATYRAALALGIEDTYLRAAYADFLLDQGRPADVLTLLAGRERNDLYLLRLAIAGRQVGHARAASWRNALAARFDAARLRGDKAHQKEEARFALEVLGEPARALELAQANFGVQRESADARVLMEAAVAARRSDAAAPALRWRREAGIESPVLARLAAALEGAR